MCLWNHIKDFGTGSKDLVTRTYVNSPTCIQTKTFVVVVVFRLVSFIGTGSPMLS